jgi:hypothetical protein
MQLAIFCRSHIDVRVKLLFLNQACSDIALALHCPRDAQLSSEIVPKGVKASGQSS